MSRHLPKAVLAADQTRAVREVSAFARKVGKDRLARRRETMIGLLEGGFASSLKEAYRLAGELDGRK